MHAFDTPGKTRLRVKNAAGLISVDPSETGRTTVELEALRDDDATRQAIERATVEMNGNEVTVEIGVGSKGFGVGPAWISFGRTPAGRRPHPLPGRHRPRVHDRIRRCRRHRPARQGGGEDGLRATSPSSTSPALRVQSASGDVRAATVDGEARLQTVSGDVRLGTVTGSVSATLVSGDFSIDDAHTDLSRQDRLRRPADRRDSGGADQRPVGLGRRPHRRPPRTRLRIDANSTSGDVSSELDVKDTPSEGSSGTRGAAGGEDCQRRHRDHPGRSRLSLT